VSQEELLRQLLHMYHTFLKTLSLEGLPRLVYQMAGELGFGALAKLYAETTKTYIDDVLKIPAETRDPTRLLEMMQDAMRAAKTVVNEPLFEFQAEQEDGRLVIHVQAKKRDRLDTLRAAPVLGMVAGVFEASGYKVYIVADASKKHVAPQGRPGTAVVTLSDCDSHSCILVEYWPPASA